MANSPSAEIPRQQQGDQADIVETITANTEEEAKALFQIARQRLFDVSHWGDISTGISASFLLTDALGEPKQGDPAPGDHFRISIPGPGSNAGNGYDWVQVEMVEDLQSESESSATAMIRVRPSEHPGKQEGVAHFLDPQATSSFIIRRQQQIVSAEVHGRNEKPNVDAQKIPDKIRNAVVGTAAAKGIGKIQWQKLVRGLLQKE
jgi:hypothetical protein